MTIDRPSLPADLAERWHWDGSILRYRGWDLAIVDSPERQLEKARIYDAAAALSEQRRRCQAPPAKRKARKPRKAKQERIEQQQELGL